MTTVGGYLSDISSAEAWEILRENPRAVLVDVRTQAEWTFVGLPDLSELGRPATPVLVEWQRYPDGGLNVRFVHEVEEELRRRGADADTPVLLLCRSGGRSAAAARTLAMEGWRACSNVADGFEGPQDANGHRGTVAGWKATGLPWRQG